MKKAGIKMTKVEPDYIAGTQEFPKLQLAASTTSTMSPTLAYAALRTQNLVEVPRNSAFEFIDNFRSDMEYKQNVSVLMLTDSTRVDQPVIKMDKNDKTISINFR